MKVSNLKVIFNNFWKNADRAILIDGPWGVGKTHYILEFLKELKKRKEFDETLENQNIAYVSLFGKSSIDEIHTDIYTKFHPVKARVKSIVNMVPKVASLITDVGGVIGGVSNVIGSLEYSLKISDDKVCKGSEENNKRYFVFLDDFERLDFGQINFNEILGYINSLIMQGLKIVVICNVEEIIKQEQEIKRNFIAFKEKVFDREYKITATNLEVINTYFDDAKLLDESLIKEFGNNLRLASRASNFYSEVMDFIAECGKFEDFEYSEKIILRYCVYVVVAANTERYSEEFIHKEKEDEWYDLLLTHNIGDENICRLIREINYHVSMINNSESSFYTNDLLNSLFNLYFYNNGEPLRNLFIEKPLIEDLFSVEIFYLSDDEKISTINKQYNYIISGGDLTNVRLYEFIGLMCDYPQFSSIDEKEEELINFLVENRHKYEKDVYHIIHFLSVHDGKEKARRIAISNKLKKRIEQSQLNELIADMKIFWDEKKYNKLVDCLGIVSTKQFCFENENPNKLKKEILQSFKDNEYFVTRLAGNIHPSLWNIAHTITNYANSYNFKDELIKQINDIKVNDDKSEQDRLDILLKKLSN